MNLEPNNEKPKIEESLVKGIASALQKAPIRSAERIYLSDLWVITSLPEDLIIEVLSKNIFELPEGVKCVIDDRHRKKRVIYPKDQKNNVENGKHDQSDN
ncbi:hypothetical protein AT15_04115 [Kosmotoga arenicorallina S304]|uniref:Uncharacterized protein n=1 Tax=Kosmotoga arenicorallina S304 TaxID=1453497 RepID=A0A176JZ00_9BACT|nr:hypothetical protein [Kosmotoga arenicorallina]OAA29183.1 hypothetical protein AT15_04115 [Kosmotoga arenicorallina S304]